MVPPYWRVSVPDTVLTSSLDVMSNSLPVTPSIPPLDRPPRPDTV